MPYQNYFLDAIDTVLSWDLPEEAWSAAVKAQACLMARVLPEEDCSD
jgi:hypothetical protein